MSSDPHATLRDRALQSVLYGPGDSDPVTRNAVADRAGIPHDLRPLIDKIHAHAYKVTDADIAGARSRHSEDALFEIIVSAAIGASRKRLLAGLAALEQA